MIVNLINVIQYIDIRVEATEATGRKGVIRGVLAKRGEAGDSEFICGVGVLLHHVCIYVGMYK